MIKVSVIVATYKQEKYIGKALDSILTQKCDFDYEVIAGDDASPDGTGEIVKKYGDAHPGKIKAIAREKNLGAFKNFKDLYSRAQGEYLAFLEGDDYWIDENKLRKQVEFLDSHKDYVASFGKCIVVDENNDRKEEIEQYIPWFKGGLYTAEEFENYYLPGQTATVMYRKSAVDQLFSQIKKDWRLMPRVPVIDRFLVLGMLSKGKIDTSTDVYAAYRYILKKESGSWSSKHDFYSFKNVIFFLYGMKEMERVAKRLGVPLSFDERRKSEFEKIACYKGQMPMIAINAVRFFIWLWYKDKRDFNAFIKERHKA